VEEKRKQDEFEAGLHNPKAASLGAVTSPVTITVFSDFQCPYCRQTAEALEKEVLPAEKDVRLVFRHLPLPMHTWARPAAEAAACAHLQSDTAFWALHDFLFEHQTELRPETLEGRLLERAVQLENFDLRKYRECTSAHATAAEVDADIAFALANTIAATPTIFVNDHRLRGAGSAEQIRSIVHQIR
jgi:protein-disulfide isomerase